MDLEHDLVFRYNAGVVNQPSAVVASCVSVRPSVCHTGCLFVRLSKSVRQQLTGLLGRQSRGRQAGADWSTLAIHLGFDCR